MAPLLLVVVVLVVASEAKQSTPAAEKMDCFVAYAPRNGEKNWPSGFLLHQRTARQFERLEGLTAGDGREQLVVVPAAFRFRRLLHLEQIHVVHHAAVLANVAVLGEHVVD